jgi:hypothetical protein
MKAFAIFPTICVFAMTLTLFNLDRQIKFQKSLIIATTFTVVFGGLMIRYSVSAFYFLYFFNVIGVLVLIPCLTYWTNRTIRRTQNTGTNWIRILGLGLVSTVLSIVLCGALTLLSFFFNPMDTPRKEIQKIGVND